MSADFITSLVISLIYPLFLLWWINKKYGRTTAIREFIVPVIIGGIIDGICILIEKYGIEVYLFNDIPKTLYDCFLASFLRNSFVEEVFKLLGFYFILSFLKNKTISNLLLSLIGFAIGFSMVESVVNILLASSLVRNAIPFLFGRVAATFIHISLSIFMVFYITTFWKENKTKGIACAFIVSFFLHGIHDFIASIQFYLNYNIKILCLCLLLYDTLMFIYAYKIFSKTIINNSTLMENEKEKNVVNSTIMENSPKGVKVPNGTSVLTHPSENKTIYAINLKYHWIPTTLMYLGVIVGFANIIASFGDAQIWQVTIIDDLFSMWGIVSIIGLLNKRKWAIISYFTYRGINIILIVILIGFGITHSDDLMIEIIRLLTTIGLFFIRKDGYNVYQTAWRNGVRMSDTLIKETIDKETNN